MSTQPANTDLKALYWEDLTKIVGPENFTNEHRLDWDASFRKDTDYIDNIALDRLKKPVMWGVDPLNRKFLAARVSEWNSTTKSQQVYIIFERYSTQNSTLQAVSPNLSTELTGTLTNSSEKTLQQLFQGKEIQVRRGAQSVQLDSE